MARRIQIKRGLYADMPTLADGELAYCVDTKKLYVGDDGNNVEISIMNIREHDVDLLSHEDIRQAIALKADQTYAESLDLLKADKATTYTKTEVDNKVNSVYKYKGSVETFSALPTDDLIIGDVYNVLDTGINYAWTGILWDDIGGVEALATEDNDGLLSKEDFAKIQAVDISGSIVYTTVAPTSDNTNGKLLLVVLESEPVTKYSGYLYMILGV